MKINCKEVIIQNRFRQDLGELEGLMESIEYSGLFQPIGITKDNILVFYHPERDSWTASCARMEAAGFQVVPSWNPYWDASGRTFEDPDGYRVVLQNDFAPGQPR